MGENCYQLTHICIVSQKTAHVKCFILRLGLSEQKTTQTTSTTNESLPEALPLLLFPKGGFLADVLTAGCLPTVLRDYPVEIICESAFAISLKEMVLAGMGIAWLPAALVRRELAQKKLVAVTH